MKSICHFICLSISITDVCLNAEYNTELYVLTTVCQSVCLSLSVCTKWFTLKISSTHTHTQDKWDYNPAHMYPLIRSGSGHDLDRMWSNVAPGYSLTPRHLAPFLLTQTVSTFTSHTHNACISLFWSWRDELFTIILHASMSKNGGCGHCGSNLCSCLWWL